jgi:hypothetical protein
MTHGVFAPASSRCRGSLPGALPMDCWIWLCRHPESLRSNCWPFPGACCLHQPAALWGLEDSYLLVCDRMRNPWRRCGGVAVMRGIGGGCDETAPARTEQGPGGEVPQPALHFERAMRSVTPRMLRVSNGTPVCVLESRDSVLLVGALCVAHSMPLGCGHLLRSLADAASAADLHSHPHLHLL